MSKIVDPADCIFCKIARREISSKIVYEDDHVVAFHDMNPQAPTHLLVMSRLHVATLNDLRAEDAGLVGELLLVAGALAEQFGIAEEGWRAVFNCNEGAGQSVWHIHMHLLGGRPLGWPPG
jgi:histidine triad (HIT) family protein